MGDEINSRLGNACIFELIFFCQYIYLAHYKLTAKQDVATTTFVDAPQRSEDGIRIDRRYQKSTKTENERRVWRMPCMRLWRRNDRREE